MGKRFRRKSDLDAHHWPREQDGLWLGCRREREHSTGVAGLGAGQGGINISHTGMIVHHARDPVYTGYEWTSQLLLKDELRLSYALRGAKDDFEMESLNTASSGTYFGGNFTTGLSWQYCLDVEF
jgi:hypothetical protein